MQLHSDYQLQKTEKYYPEEFDYYVKNYNLKLGEYKLLQHLSITYGKDIGRRYLINCIQFRNKTIPEELKVNLPKASLNVNTNCQHCNGALIKHGFTIVENNKKIQKLKCSKCNQYTQQEYKNHNYSVFAGQTPIYAKPLPKNCDLCGGKLHRNGIAKIKNKGENQRLRCFECQKSTYVKIISWQQSK
jgi:hypothetical protein